MIEMADMTDKTLRVSSVNPSELADVVRDTESHMGKEIQNERL